MNSWKLDFDNYKLEYPSHEPINEECKPEIFYVYVVDDLVKIKYVINVPGERREAVTIIPPKNIVLNESNIISLLKGEEISTSSTSIHNKSIIDHISDLTHIHNNLELVRKALDTCSSDLKGAGEKVYSTFEKIDLDQVESDDIYKLNQALQYTVRIVKGEVIDLTDENNPIAELEKIRKQLNKHSRLKQAAAALFLFIGVALIVGVIVACVLFPPVGLVGLALGIVVAKILGVTLAGAVSTYYSVKTLHKEWKHKKSPLKLAGDELAEFTLKAKENVRDFTPSFFIEYCGNQEIIDLKRPDARRDIAGFKPKIIYTPQVINDILTSDETKNDDSRDASRDKLLTLLPKDLSTEEKKSVSAAILAARAGITKSSQAGGLNAGPVLLNYYFASLLGVPINPLSEITKIEKIDNGFSIKTAFIPDTYILPPPPGSMVVSEIKKPFQYRETYHLVKVGDNWELTIKSNNLNINPELWKIMLENVTNKLDSDSALTNDDLFTIVPCLADAKFAEVFRKKLKAQPTIMPHPEVVSKLISANYGDKWPVHLKNLKSVINTIESNIPKKTPPPRPAMM